LSLQLCVSSLVQAFTTTDSCLQNNDNWAKLS